MQGHKKLIQSGKLIELYEYARQCNKPKVNLSRPKRSDPGLFKNTGPSRYTVSRRKGSFVRIVAANLGRAENPAFLTLTMLQTCTVREAYGCFNRFASRLRVAFGKQIRYVAVPEFQERGAVHFHVLIWGIPNESIKSERNSRRIQNLWGYGYVDGIPTDGSVKLAHYFAKYMSKSLQDVRILGQRAYCVSRNALRPVSLSTENSVTIAKDVLGLVDNSPSFEKFYVSKYLGVCHYRIYNLQV